MTCMVLPLYLHVGFSIHLLAKNLHLLETKIVLTYSSPGGSVAHRKNVEVNRPGVLYFSARAVNPSRASRYSVSIHFADLNFMLPFSAHLNWMHC